jgi:sugar phosphate permease
MEKDLGLTNLQYSQGLAVFYATYVFSELPSNLVLKKVSPRIWLPTLTVVWGIITMCLGFVRSFASFAAVRAMLGIAEGGLLPGMVLYLSSIYTRGELALRIGIFYTAASLSGAFGGEFLPAGEPYLFLSDNEKKACLLVDSLQSVPEETLKVGDGS